MNHFMQTPWFKRPIPDPPTEDYERAEREHREELREQFLSDQADAIYRDAELYIEALDSAEAGEICDDEWRVDMKCERVRVRDARRMNDPEKYAEACVGMDDLAIKACRAYAEWRVARGIFV